MLEEANIESEAAKIEPKEAKTVEPAVESLEELGEAEWWEEYSGSGGIWDAQEDRLLCLFMASKEKHNARWDPYTTKNLLEICVKEIRISGKPGVSFKARRWEVVVDEFNKRANKNYNQKQLKNRLDNLKLDWTTWKQLLGKETGLGWNHETGTIVADDTWWEAKIKDNGKYVRFRYQGLEFREELEIIFGETVATSQRSWTPATGAPSEDSSIKTNPTIPKEIDEYDEEETNLDEDASHMVNNQLKRKKIASETMSKKLAKGKQKSGIATSMLAI
ncbi:hypothetical protein K1719_017743 [Acacia pycnantha]|nr:hypothetical protein K1719_017743 [Acacia pycnantha]